MKNTKFALPSLAALACALTIACAETSPKPRPGAGNPVVQPESPAGGVNQVRENSAQNPANGPRTNNPQTLEPAVNVAKDPKVTSPQAPGVSPGTTTGGATTTAPPTAVAPPASPPVVDPNAPKAITAKVTTVLVGTGTESSKYCTLMKNTKLTLKGAPVANPGSGGQVIIDFEPTASCKPDGVFLVHATVVRSEFDGW